MSCPYIGTFSGDRPAGNRPNVNNVCHAQPNPHWSYGAVDVEAQTYYCFSRSYARCPRFKKAQAAGILPPARPRRAPGSGCLSACSDARPDSR